MIEAYPLKWPQNKPRTSRAERSRFDVSQDRAQRGIMEQIRMLGGKLPVISTNVELRRDGLPYANQKVQDCGVVVYFTYKNQQMCFACDRWDSVQDNMQAINKTIEALRGIERWGSGDMVQQAFRGFAELEAPGTKRKREWWQVLGVDKNENFFQRKEAYKNLAKKFHPDLGGSHEAMSELNSAAKEAGIL